MQKSLVIINSRGLLHKQKGGHLPLSIQAEVKAPPESLHENLQATADKCKWAVQFVVYHGSTTESQMCPPPSQASLLGYGAGVMNNISLWKCWCVPGNHRGEERWRQPLSKEDGSWQWACPPAAWACGEPGSYNVFGKTGARDGERQEGRYRKWMASECLPMEKWCARIQTE